MSTLDILSKNTIAGYIKLPIELIRLYNLKLQFYGYRLTHSNKLTKVYTIK